MTTAGSWLKLDRQLAKYKDRLCREVDITGEESCKVSTFIAKEIRFSPLLEAKEKIETSSHVLPSKRHEELVAFQSWTEWVSSVGSRPDIVRAHVITEIYICLVYLTDACFKAIHYANIDDDSVVGRCTKYLSTGKRRKFRNAFAHANWQYKSDFSGFECWVEERGHTEHFDVSQEDFTFWCVLSRGVAYPIYELLKGTP